jgi:hypothetical protein|tara:strand:+ start:12568 stop:13149 length:582 start_codon:yes stop_codon:yes gene_type:complete
MRVQFYKPNPKETGSACSFWQSEDGSIMSSLIKQDSWDSKLKRGSFSKNKDNPNKKVIIKLNITEAGSIIDAIESNRKWSGYHQSKNQVTKINFGPYERGGEQIGFSYSVNKEDKEDSTNKTGFIIGFTFGEGVVLREALCEAIKCSVFSNNEEQSSSPAPKKSSPPRSEKPRKDAKSDLSIEEDILDNEDMW